MLTRYGRGVMTWIDLTAPTGTEVRSLMQEYDIDPTIAEELLLPSFKSKVERRGEALYVILHFPSQTGSGLQSQQEVDFVFGKNFLITAHYETIDPLHSFAKAFEVEGVLGRESTHTHGGHLFCTMLQNLYRALLNESEAVKEQLAGVEERIFKGDEKQMVVELSYIGRTIHDFRQVLLPHKEMLKSLEAPAARLFGQEFSYHLRTTEGSYERVEREFEALRDSLGELRETNNALLSTKQNEIMKTLTVLAFVFLPLSFIGTIFGMNTVNNPIIGSRFDFWTIVSGMILLAALFFLYFKRKGWL
jgi:magnesium transporter